MIVVLENRVERFHASSKDEAVERRSEVRGLRSDPGTPCRTGRAAAVKRGDGGSPERDLPVDPVPPHVQHVWLVVSPKEFADGKGGSSGRSSRLREGSGGQGIKRSHAAGAFSSSTMDLS